MGMQKPHANSVIALALFHLYGWIAVMGCCVLAWQEYAVQIIGISCLLFAVWSVVGYQLQWKHIYYSYQDTNHQKITPNSIRWHTVKKSDAYDVPLVFLILGLACLVIAVC